MSVLRWLNRSAHEGRVPDGLEWTPRLAAMDDLCFAKASDKVSAQARRARRWHGGARYAPTDNPACAGKLDIHESLPGRDIGGSQTHSMLGAGAQDCLLTRQADADRRAHSFALRACPNPSCASDEQPCNARPCNARHRSPHTAVLARLYARRGTGSCRRTSATPRS